VTIGSDIISVLNCLKSPEQVLGKDEVARLGALDPAGFYPIQHLLELMEKVDQRIGHFGLLAMGRSVFKLSHEENAKKMLKMIEALEEHDDVQNVYANFDIDDALLQELA
jgi:hypothetical protein